MFALDDPRPRIDEAKQRDDVVVVELEMVNQRLIPVAIEPRAVLATWNEGYERFEVYSSSQIPHALGGAIAKIFGLASNAVHVIAPEVGGGFGCKLNVYPDEILVCFASKQLHAPGALHRDAAGVGRVDHPGTWVGRHGRDHRYP